MRFILTAAIVAATTVTSFAQNDSAAIFLQKGLEEKAKGRVMESYKALDKAYSYNKNDKQIVAELANVLVALRRYQPAREKFMQLESMGDQSAETYKQIMSISFNLRQYNDAIKYANLAKKADPTQKVAYFIGKAYYDQDYYGDAIKNLTIAATEDPQNAEVPYMMGRCYADMMNYKPAIAQYEKAIALDPSNSRWLYELGLIYYATHDDKSALKTLLLAADKGYKRDNEYLENLGIAYLNSGETEKGLVIMQEMLQRRPTDMNILNMVAEACYDAKRFDDAINYWDQVLALDKQNASALFMIGMSYQKKGDKGKGQALCDKAIEMDPSLAKNKKQMQMPGM